MVFAADSFEFKLILVLTIITVLFKLVMVLYLGNKIRQAKRDTGPSSTEFMTGMWIFMLALLISRIFYMIFDFYFTKFDMTKYADLPDVWFWKTGQMISGLGIAYLIDVVDRKILQRKFKGILTFIMVAGAIMVMVIPINTLDDFALVSTVSMIPQLGVVIVPFVFISLGLKATGELRQTSWMIVLASILLAFASIVVNGGIVNALNAALAPNSIDVYLYLVQMVCKIGSYSLFVIASNRFKI